MGSSIVLQDENCNNISEIITDPQSVISNCLPDPSDTSYTCLRFIDPYGDTVFNGLQAKVLLEEWRRLEPFFVERDAEQFWADVRDLIARCSQEPHVYLRFVGD